MRKVKSKIISGLIKTAYFLLSKRFTACMLSIMGLIVSCVALSINNSAKDIANK